jgi:hypothetical protein
MYIVDKFIPKDTWFHFQNKFNASTIYWHFIPVGNAKYGLCGGMVYTVNDYFDASYSIPAISQAPTQEQFNDLLEYIKGRQVDACFNWSALKYLKYMMTSKETDCKESLEAWKGIKDSLDNDELVPIGLVKVKSYNPANIIYNHQVLAYGYDIQNHLIRIYVYDPNQPLKDDIKLSFIDNDCDRFYIETDVSLRPVYMFFISEYDAKIATLYFI